MHLNAEGVWLVWDLKLIGSPAWWGQEAGKPVAVFRDKQYIRMQKKKEKSLIPCIGDCESAKPF